ncbi:uncharacterized protein PV09_05147 [Verruconis gallopava]|uniref:Large ribosomal subunit protein mL43 n=1 Tax=Verruconis gallopava TaxID=253628 RepID=A0A0D2AAP4_9PEZI|nr:uncharacterized protein PV09_05147 [Verruconis gallopava]KIW03848.1 hypothetical protein PV09_05147 [Verruconis gallopava]
MPLRALRTIAKSQNGVGAHIIQCKKLDFHYCDHGGSSKGMKAFLTHQLPAFARANASIEMAVSPRPNHHPVIRGHYTNGAVKAICVRSLEPDQVRLMAERLRDTCGEPWKRVVKPVKSVNESVRGVWSGVHGSGIVVGDDGSWTTKKKTKGSPTQV